MPPSASSLEESKVTEKKEEDENLSYEKWRCKRSWKVHKGGVSDLAWSPDNIHLGTCGTDSTVIIWNINETSPIRIIDAKANGITFDPFGKFMAT
jgi:WD40 repeat protein